MPETVDMVRIDAKTFQEPLEKLGETLAQKLMREGSAYIGATATVCEDLAMMLRYSLSVYRLLLYLNAEVRRKSDTDWNVRYGATAMSLVRSLIDCLYNITSILQNPSEKGAEYRKSGLRKMLEDLNEDYEKYRGQPAWEAFVAERKGHVEMLIRTSGFTVEEVMKQPFWPTLGAYLSVRKTGGVLTEHQEFLKTFTFLGWRQYSALSHGAYEAFMGTLGHVPVASYYISDFLPAEARPKVEASYEVFVSTHIGRAALVLLSIITEVQAYARFDGANINDRIVKMWDALLPLFEGKELHNARYAKLMSERGIVR
jgi:hypothetical protein